MSWSAALAILLPPFLKVFALVASLVGLALGIALVAGSAPTLRLLRALNRWISTRRAIKSLEVPRPSGVGHRAVAGAIALVVGVYALVVLAPPEAGPRLALALGADPRTSIAGITIDSLRWILVAGSAFAVLAGLLMLLAPRAFAALEARANVWISSRRLVAGADTMHLPLDGLAERHPRAFGAALALLAAAGAAASALLLAAS